MATEQGRYFVTADHEYGPGKIHRPGCRFTRETEGWFTDTPPDDRDACKTCKPFVPRVIQGELGA